MKEENQTITWNLTGNGKLKWKCHQSLCDGLGWKYKMGKCP